MIIWSFGCLAVFGGDTIRGHILPFALGGAMMQTLADLVLVRHTLAYEKASLTIIQTPWWMVLLWTIALTQVTYVAVRFPQLPYIVFVIISGLYFYLFEIAVSRWAKWWWRRDCWQPFGVAFYATVAEIITVALIPYILASGLSPLPLGLLYGGSVAPVFIGLGMAAHRN